MTREERRINQIVGIKDGRLYTLEYVFKYSDGFKGAKGYCYSTGVITQSYNGDDTYRAKIEKLVEELPSGKKQELEKVFGVMGEDFSIWSVVGRGRCFNANDEWDVIFRPDLVELIREYV